MTTLFSSNFLKIDTLTGPSVLKIFYFAGVFCVINFLSKWQLEKNVKNSNNVALKTKHGFLKISTR